MGSPSDYTSLLKFLASHGFVVIGSTAGNVQDGGSSGNQFRNKMVEVAEWVVEQNSNSSSELHQKIDTEKIGAAGHSQGGYGASEAGQNPLITTTVSSCGAVGSGNQQGPALILCGGNDNNSGARCSDHPEDAYNGTNNVPVMKGEYHNADHGWCMDFMGSSDPDNPHEMLMAMTAWFRYHLMGDEEYKSWFYGPESECGLCNDDGWNVKRKGMD
jgi:dipeptidyl aminopeptidase/acylaminoacyl peptidase